MSDERRSRDAASQPVLDRLAFERASVLHRRELKVHCYRMMGSLDDADDLVQDTLLRAWKARGSFDGRGSLRGWLYAIATNCCLNALRARTTTRRVLQQIDRGPTTGPATSGPSDQTAWLEPYPDAELPDVVDGEPGPEALYESREAIQLAFVAAIQSLPPKQRAALLLSDVLGWSALEIADLLDGTLAATNSLLQRARATLTTHYPIGRPTQRLKPGPVETLLLAQYMQAWQSQDLDGFTALLREDATYNMPPWGDWYQGRAAIRGFLDTVWMRYSGYHAVKITANAQPAIALYARSGDDPIWKAHSLHIITPAEGRIASLTVYVTPLGPGLFPKFALPVELGQGA
ncbi:MAG: RNA polymerase subunit sigma-70 [Deltaproteobacteria bacterium]